MPSEAPALEPRDRAPPPPVTRAGRSAHLAKAAAAGAATSATERRTSERRTRGRPRKDGSSTRAVPPSPPPPPPPRNRKKGRSRSRVAVGDEDDVDTAEDSGAQRTAVKETAGRRQSTSRRKYNIKPDPGPEPEPEAPPRPHEAPPHDPWPGPLPAAEGGHCPGSLAEADSPRTPPPPLSLDLSPTREGRRSSRSSSPAHTEPEGVGASPSAQSSPFSAPFSPPASPRLRLEDEDSLSPLPLSEDSGGSPAASLGRMEERLKKQCAFCYRGDDLCLGQGHLVVFGPTPGYIPLHVLNRRASPDRDNDCHDHRYRGDHSLPRCSSPELSDPSSSEFVQQLGPIGLPLDINVQSLFDPTGQCCAHLQCAAWSDCVCLGEGQSLLYVDKAIDSGSTQVCSFCRRLGATLRCRETGCGRSYHFVCAAAAGAHLDWKDRHTLCTRHTHTGLSRCVSCSGCSDVGDLLMCSCCGYCYHGSCLDPPLVPSPLCRAGWQCPKCRVCQSCRLRGDDSQLLLCERCGKVYHSHCLTPPLDHTPSAGWSCKVCRVCLRCGVRSSGQWANHPFLCVSCDPALPCPGCGGVHNLSTAEDWETCSHCFRSVHAECLVQSRQSYSRSEGYLCSNCSPPTQAPPLNPTKTTSARSPQRLMSSGPGPSETPQTPLSPSDTHHGPPPGSSDPPQNPALLSSESPHNQMPTATTVFQGLSPPESGPSEAPLSPVLVFRDHPQSPDPPDLPQPGSPQSCAAFMKGSPIPGPSKPLQRPSPAAPPSPEPSEPPQCPGPTSTQCPKPSKSTQNPGVTSSQSPGPLEPLQSPGPTSSQSPKPSKSPQSPGPTSSQSPGPSEPLQNPNPTSLQSPASPPLESVAQQDPLLPELPSSPLSPIPTDSGPSDRHHGPQPTSAGLASVAPSMSPSFVCPTLSPPLEQECPTLEQDCPAEDMSPLVQDPCTRKAARPHTAPCSPHDQVDRVLLQRGSQSVPSSPTQIPQITWTSVLLLSPKPDQRTLNPHPVVLLESEGLLRSSLVVSSRIPLIDHHSPHDVQSANHQSSCRVCSADHWSPPYVHMEHHQSPPRLPSADHQSPHDVHSAVHPGPHDVQSADHQSPPYEHIEHYQSPPRVLSLDHQSPLRVPSSDHQSPPRVPSLDHQNPPRVPSLDQQSPPQVPCANHQSPVQVPSVDRQSLLQVPSADLQSPPQVLSADHQSPHGVPSADKQSPDHQSSSSSLSPHTEAHPCQKEVDHQTQVSSLAPERSLVQLEDSPETGLWSLSTDPILSASCPQTPSHTDAISPIPLLTSVTLVTKVPPVHSAAHSLRDPENLPGHGPWSPSLDSTAARSSPPHCTLTDWTSPPPSGPGQDLHVSPPEGSREIPHSDPVPETGLARTPIKHLTSPTVAQVDPGLQALGELVESEDCITSKSCVCPGTDSDGSSLVHHSLASFRSSCPGPGSTVYHLSPASSPLPGPLSPSQTSPLPGPASLSHTSPLPGPASPSKTSTLTGPASPSQTNPLPGPAGPSEASVLLCPASPSQTIPCPGPARPSQTSPLSGPASPSWTSPLPGPASPTRTSPLPGPSSPSQTSPLTDPTSPSRTSPLPGPASPSQTSPLPGPASSLQTSPLPGSASPVQNSPLPGLASPSQTSPLPGPTSPSQTTPLASPESPLQSSLLPGPASPLQSSPLPGPASVPQIIPLPCSTIPAQTSPHPGPASPPQSCPLPGPAGPPQSGSLPGPASPRQNITLPVPAMLPQTCPVPGPASPAQTGPLPGLASPAQTVSLLGPASLPQAGTLPGPASPPQNGPLPCPASLALTGPLTGPASPPQTGPLPYPSSLALSGPLTGPASPPQTGVLTGPVSPSRTSPLPGPTSPSQTSPLPGPASPPQTGPVPGPVSPALTGPPSGPVSPPRTGPLPGTASPALTGPLYGPASPPQTGPLPGPASPTLTGPFVGPVSPPQTSPLPGPPNPALTGPPSGPASPTQTSPLPGPASPAQTSPLCESQAQHIGGLRRTSPLTSNSEPARPGLSPCSPGQLESGLASPVEPGQCPGPGSPVQAEPGPVSSVDPELSPGSVQKPNLGPGSPVEPESSLCPSSPGPVKPVEPEQNPGPVSPIYCGIDDVLRRCEISPDSLCPGLCEVEQKLTETPVVLGHQGQVEEGPEDPEQRLQEGPEGVQKDPTDGVRSNDYPEGTPLLDPAPASEEETSSCRLMLDHSQSQSLLGCATIATELIKVTCQSQAEFSEEETVSAPRPISEEEGEEEEEEPPRAPQPISEEEEEEEAPVSPVLDLDSSLDLEVMDLMGSSPPPSLLHLSSPSPPMPPRRGKGWTFRPPRCASSRPADDLSLRLKMSPFSTEASPETSPTRTPDSPAPLRELPLSKLPVPPPTLLPLTPKIGMGKPAISKRKFSPGRVRLSRQGSWWSNRHSSSQESMGEGGWDSPKHHTTDSPLWNIKVGRGSGFPGRRRSRGGGGGRGGRGRSRLKTQESPSVCAGSGHVEPFQVKEEEENSMHNTVVMFSTSDHFTLKQDMCVVCGSFGQGAEGRLLACSQCGQCYHPYCVNVKITRVVLTKGWRCLECTVCEACGQASDPGRLLLCDDCDISYHTYCLQPPLLTVPKGAWKCKWCVWCVQCGSTSPGLHCEWQNNYSRCGPCSSLSRCPLCQRSYSQDELVLQCQQCDRWVHASCQGLSSEDDVELAADEGFDCALCQTQSRVSHGRTDALGSFMAQIVSKTREHETKTYTQDGVCLTESGLSHLQSLVEPLTSPRRYRRCKPKLKLRIINQNSVSVLQTPESELQAELDPSRADLECEIKSDSSPERDHAPSDEISRDAEVTDGNKKRKRKPYRPGIGGFMVRQRGGRSGPSRIKLCRRDSTDTLPGPDEGLLDADVSMETVIPGEQSTEKVKKRYRKKKTKLEEEFPSYLQDAFFGRDLLARSRLVDHGTGPETAPGQAEPPVPPAPTMAAGTDSKPETRPMSEDALLDLSSVLITDPHILSSRVSAGLDITSVTTETPDGGGRVRPGSEEPLDAILSPELDKMVSEGDILSKLYKIPELEGKDVEEVFTAVLSPNSSNNRLEQSQHTHNSAVLYHRLPLNGMVSPALVAGGGASGLFTVAPDSAPGSAPASQTSGESGQQDGPSTPQRGVQKWEKEESLGMAATVAPVLYCNTNFPQLREQYPDWSSRMKQIAKLWRKASAQDRAPYVQKARDNRAAQRISKVSTPEALKRPPQIPLPPPQNPPQPPPHPPLQVLPTFDSVSMDPDLTFKDPLRPKESEQEQEWKFRQQMRQKTKQLAKLEACQKLEQVKMEQLQRQRGRPSPETSPSFLPPPRPTSPWDPYRPPSSSQMGPNSLSASSSSSSSSPLHEAVTSSPPTPSPDSKTSGVQPGLQQSRATMSPSPGFRSVRVPGPESYLSLGGIFKAPMPPLQQEVLGSPGGGRREHCKSLDPGKETPFPSSPHRGPRSDPDPPGTPRPHTDLAYLTTPPSLRPDQFPQRPSPSHPEPLVHSPGGATGLSPAPLAPGTNTDQPCPGRQDGFPRNPGPDPFDLGHRAADQTTGEPSPLDGPLPQIGDSEEKLRQRQRLRQLILRQQQQKNTLRQEAGAGPGPSPGMLPGPASATPLHSWTQENAGPTSTAHPVDPFGRPPPPYPGGLFGPGGPVGPRIPVLNFPRQPPPQSQRFGGPPPGLQDSFLDPPQVPVSVQMRPAELTGIRPPQVPSNHLVSGFPRTLPPQQHSIMGRPYIELRHRLRVPFALPTASVVPPTGTRIGGDQLGQQNQSQRASTELLLPIDEPLEDSAVKDLEDVEVKDLVDLNLNLDPEDGKEDLDLHLDDFLLSGKFDLIAYTDPELDLVDKKDMFNEELDLDPAEDREVGAGRPPGPAGPSRPPGLPRPPGLLAKDQAPPSGPVQDLQPPTGPVQATVSGGPLFQQRPFGPSQTPPVLLLSPGPSSQNQNKSRPLLLEEQPLLLQDLLDQERQEQQQQKQMQALIRHKASPEPPGFPNMDPIMKAKMVALKGINKVMSQGNLSLNRFQPTPGNPGAPEGPPPPPPPPLRLGQEVQFPPQLVRPLPPSFGASFINEAQRQQYEEWLGETRRLLQMQQRLLEEQIAAHRKAKKALSAKQRTAKRAGRSFAEEDQLLSISQQQGVVQRQLEQIRKQQKDHAELIEDYHSKHRPLQPPLAPPSPQAQLAPPIHITTATPQAHLGPSSPRTNLAPPIHLPPPSHMVTPTHQAHLAPPSPRPHLAPPSPRPHLAPPTQVHLAPPSPRAHVALPTQAHLAPPSPRPHMTPPTQAHLTPPLPRSQMATPTQAHLAPPSPRPHMTPPTQAHLAPPSPRPHMTPPTQSHLAPPSPRPHLAPPSQAHLAPPTRGAGPGVPLPVWASGPMGQAASPHPPTPPSGTLGPGATPKPQVKFDDNNPFSDCFQERERRERLQEQQERQRVQLMQEVERHRALQQRLDQEQQGHLGAPQVPGGDSVSPMSVFRSELPSGFLQALPGQRGPPPHHQPGAPPIPFQAVLPGGSTPRQQLYTNIKKTSQRDEDILAPPTLASLDHSDPSSLPGLPVVSAHHPQLVLGVEGQRQSLEVKVEREESGACGGRVVKKENSLSPVQGGDGGKELLRHLLRDKMSPPTEEEERPGPQGHVEAPDQKKLQRCKRAGRLDRDRAPPKHKRRRKDEEENLHCTTSPDQEVNRQLPLMEPVLQVDLGLFPPYGSLSLGRDSRLSGSFGNGSLDGVTDFYSHLIYKQNNLSNPPTPPASLPPTPPPVARQKLLNGFASMDELKDMSEHDVKAASPLKHKGEELLTLSHASKTVDIPASLPTPPHNNQEELRVQGLDSFVPSSSPESLVDAEISRYPDLSWIKLEPPSPCPSPPFPITPSAWGKAKQEVKAESNLQAPPSCSSTDLVTIAITLNPVASQNVPGVMAAVAQLLRVSVPLDYRLSLGGPQGSVVNQSSTGCGLQRPGVFRMNSVQHGGSTQRCSFCKVLLGPGVQIVRELKQEAGSRLGPGLVFCSPGCSENQRSEGNQCAAPPEPALTPQVQHQYANNMSSIAVHSLPHTHSPSSSPSSPLLSFPPASAVTMQTKPRADSLKVKVKLKPHPRAVPGGDEPLSSRYLKRARSPRWRRWSVSISLSRSPCVPSEAVAMPTEEEIDALLQKSGSTLRPDLLPRDQRRCCFCHQQGDGQTDGPARLLNLDLDLWVHLNCALWSSEVYETQAGALINVELALRRGLALRCVHCQKTGATSGCNRLRCTNTYHFTCALQASCTFFKDKTMLCPLHKPRSCSGSSPDPVAPCDPYDSELRCFAVFRRVFVQRDEARQIAAVVQRGERQHTFRVGALLFRAVGRLLPHQMASFHNQAAIFPVGYHANRFYWSMRHSHRRCKYVCSIEEKDGRPQFRLKVVERGHEDLVLTGHTPKAVWDQVLEPLSFMRTKSGTLKLFPVYLKGEDLFGLTATAVTRIIESLPGVEACDGYSFRFGRNPLMEWPLAFNPSGSARTEAKACHNKRLLSSVAPRCQGSVGSIVGAVPGVLSLSPGESLHGMHHGRHSKSSQYRRMKAEWKSNVYLARSRIQGLGLYAARDIEKCTMVIEYIGTIIRSEVANRKERLYEAQNRGVYMFRIDNDYVIDATITGGPARYINHSCAPNCITEVVSVEKENKIIISSCRRIQRGEELSYDYKFDLEDDQHKIPCHCGALNCHKWMN